MYDEWDFDGKPLFYLDRKVVAVIAVLFACLSGYWYLHFTGLSEAFGEDAVATRGKVMALEKRACGFTDHCLENQSAVYTARIAFRDRSGRQRESLAELRFGVYATGQKVDMHYLSGDPTKIVAGDLDFQHGIWTILRIQLAIVTMTCVFFAIGYYLPKGTLIRD